MKKLIMEGPKTSKIIDVPMPEMSGTKDVLIKNRYELGEGRDSCFILHFSRFGSPYGDF